MEPLLWNAFRNTSAIPTSPSAPLRWLRIFFLMAQPPLLYQEGSSRPTPQIGSEYALSDRSGQHEHGLRCLRRERPARHALAVVDAKGTYGRRVRHPASKPVCSRENRREKNPPGDYRLRAAAAETHTVRDGFALLLGETGICDTRECRNSGSIR